MNLPLLYQLQNLHKEMDIIEKKLKELRETSDLAKLKKEYQRLKGEHLKGEESLKKNAYQQEIRNNEIKNLDENKRACEEVKFSRDTDSVKKLDTIEKQLQQIEEKKQVVENHIITLIGEVDNTNKELAETKKKSTFIKRKYASSKETIEKTIEELEAKKLSLQPQIDSLIKKADKESFDMYTRLIKAHADAVALVENRTCMGCNMEVPAMDFEALKSGSQEMRCQSCGRLLYYIKP